ncbi:MAG: PAS domain-containing protein [Verrucomicrobia bacterium]|nr:PAS domain-containing protein [Verrucomicrobiota bacterium]
MSLSLFCVESDPAYLEKFRQHLEDLAPLTLLTTGAEVLEQVASVGILVVGQVEGMAGEELLQRVRTLNEEVVGILLVSEDNLVAGFAAASSGLALRSLFRTASGEELRAAVSAALKQRALIQLGRDAAQVARESRDIHRALNQHAIVEITDVQGRILSVNDKFCELSGYSREELVGGEHRRFNSGYHSNEFFRELWTTVQAGRIWQGEIRNRARDGSCHWVDTTIVPFLGNDQKPYQYVVIRNNITDRKRVEDALVKSKDELFRTLNSMGEAVLTTDRERRVQQLNPMAEQLTGWSREEALGQPVDDVMRILREDTREPAVLPIERVMETGLVKGLSNHTILVARDGTEYSIADSSAPIRNSDGQVIGVVIVFRDVTQERRSREALELATTRLALATQTAGVGIWDWDVRANRLLWDEAMYRLYGVTAAQFSGAYAAWLSGLHPEDRARQDGEIQAALAGEREFKTEFRVVWPDSSIRVIQANGVVIRDDAGRPVRMLGTNWDITSRKQAEETIREQKQILELILDQSLAGYWDWWIPTNTEYLSPNFKRMFGYTDEDMASAPESWQRLIFPEDLTRLQEVFQRHVQSQGRVPYYGEVRYRHKDGSTVWVICAGRVIRWDDSGQPLRVIGCHIDITERKRIEERGRQLNLELERNVQQRTSELVAVNASLRTQEERYRRVTEATNDVIWEWNLPTRSFWWNENFHRTFGYPLGDVSPSPQAWLDRIHPEDRTRVNEALQLLLARGETRWSREFRFRRADGTYAIVHDRGSVIQCSEGEPIRLVGAMSDITDRRLAEQRIRTQLEHLSLLDEITRAIGEHQDLNSVFQVVIRSLEESLPIDFGCVCLLDRVLYQLRVARVGVGSQALAMELALTEAGTHLAIDENGLGRCVRGELVYEPDLREVPFPFPQRLARGGLGSLVLSPLRVDDQVIGLLVVARRKVESFSSSECEFLRQVTDHMGLAAHQAELHGALQQAYEELHQSQQTAMQQERLRALGQMASGIAHDINNAISPIALYTQLLLEQEKALSARGREYLEIVGRAIEDVAATVARMREFYRQRAPQSALVPVDLNALAQQVINLTRVRWSDMPQLRGAVIRVEFELAPGLSAVRGIESELREALINLVFNAVDAMSEGGTLTVRTRATGDGLSALNWIEIADTGAGMDEDTRRRCLEPFFTTKGERGTGLGLAMVYGVARRHGAELEIDSQPGQGTAFRLGFPPHEVLIRSEQAKPTVTAAPRRKLRLLVVDDDPLLLKSLRDSLESEGHLVVTANGGQLGIEAFREAQAKGATFSAVITDLGMPHVDGRKVAKEIRLLSPETPIILLTGWGQRLVAEGEVPPGVDRLLNKPPKLRDLRSALAECCAVGPEGTSALPAP